MQILLSILFEGVTPNASVVKSTVPEIATFSLVGLSIWIKRGCAGLGNFKDFISALFFNHSAHSRAIFVWFNSFLNLIN